MSTYMRTTRSAYSPQDDREAIVANLAFAHLMIFNPLGWLADII